MNIFLNLCCENRYSLCNSLQRKIKSRILTFSRLPRVLKHLKTGENDKESVFLDLHKVVKKSAKIGILPMPT
jgi:hypothetical protein